nr:quinone-interacting membrane-bound oxidoreductase complex subunit QmoC [candidate division Zixibacteria bacterium]
MANGHLVEPDLRLIREIKTAGGNNLKQCYQCATCSVVCNLSPEDNPFPRKEMLLAQWGRTDRLIADPDIWMCYQCNDCTIHCPRGARPGDVLAAIRSYIYRNFSFPSFMGRALASPKALPVLFLVPILILLACVIFSAPIENGKYLFLSSARIDFDYFLPHKTVDALFVFGMILIFIFAATGFIRFWKTLKSSGPKPEKSFISSSLVVMKEIISHSNFGRCETNRPRRLWHMLLLGGFVGSMIVTGAVFLLIFIPHYAHDWKLFEIHLLPWPPIELPNPIKILGALSGLALVIGGAMLIIRRWQKKDEVGANGYTDYLFLYILFFVGLTGMLSWLTRSYMGMPLVAYANYFIHMVFVFFLLWYMPYSKFAHMIYRTLALIYVHSIGRTARN